MVRSRCHLYRRGRSGGGGMHVYMEETSVTNDRPTECVVVVMVVMMSVRRYSPVLV